MIEDPEHLTWALGVRTRGVGRVRLSTRGKEQKPCPFIKRVNIKRPLRSRLGLAYNLGVLDMVGLPTPVLMRIPEKGVMISALTRRAKETASRNTLRWGSKNGSNKGFAVV